MSIALSISILFEIDLWTIFAWVFCVAEVIAFCICLLNLFIAVHGAGVLITHENFHHKTCSHMTIFTLECHEFFESTQEAYDKAQETAHISFLQDCSAHFHRQTVFVFVLKGKKMSLSNHTMSIDVRISDVQHGVNYECLRFSLESSTRKGLQSV